MSFVKYDLYEGSKLFSSLADSIGFPLDMVNFVIAQVTALLAAGALRSSLRGAPPALRHTLCLALGLLTGYFCFGKKAIHLALLPLVCFFMIKTAPERIMANSVLGAAIAYLSCIHLHRQFYYIEEGHLDITGPLMVISQRVTSVAFCIHDGREKRGDANSTEPTRDNGGHEALPKPPSALEFLSFSLAFLTLLCGPALTFKLYMDFINNRVSQAQLNDEPNRKRAVIGKIFGAIAVAVVHLTLSPLFPTSGMSSATGPQSDWSYIYILWFCFVATLAVRCKYYLAWTLSDAVCNNAGIGFREPNKWDAVSNIDIVGFETAGSFREAVAKWNPGTTAWLRLVVYSRVRSQKLLQTFALSAIWHGFYPGYYLTFATGALFTIASRKTKRFFTTLGWSGGKLFNILSFALTRVFMTYATVPFVLLDLTPALALYKRVFFVLHWVALGTLLLPGNSLKPQVTSSKLGVSSSKPGVSSSKPGVSSSNGSTSHANGKIKSS